MKGGLLYQPSFLDTGNLHKHFAIRLRVMLSYGLLSPGSDTIPFLLAGDRSQMRTALC